MYDDWELTYDIVMLKLEQNLVFSASVRPIELPSQNFDVPHGSVATISGWGDLEFRGGRYPENLQTTPVPVIGNPECQIIYDEENIRPDQLCAGEPGRDACQGDSGKLIRIINLKAIINILINFRWPIDLPRTCCWSCFMGLWIGQQFTPEFLNFCHLLFNICKLLCTIN